MKNHYIYSSMLINIEIQKKKKKIFKCVREFYFSFHMVSALRCSRWFRSHSAHTQRTEMFSENNKNRNRKKSIPRVYFSKSNTKGYISATTTTDNRQLQPIIPIGKLFIIDFLARFSFLLVSTFVCTILWYMSTLTTYILYNTLNEMWYLCLAISLLFCSHSHALRRWPSQTV